MNHLNINQIKEIIPHRHPFLLLDYIEDYVPGDYAVGYKCVSYREELHISAVSINANSKERSSRETRYVWRRRSSAEKDLSVSARQLRAWMEK